jgi:3-oxoacyl-(acyl-carrier-protein) synthase
VGYGVNALKSALLTNASGLQSCARFDSPRFQSSVVGAAPSNEADTFADDPAYRLADEALRQVREQSRDLLQSISPDGLGLVLSTTKANIEAMERLADQRACSEAARRHLQGDLLAADLAAAHGAKGPVQCVSLACISGLVAIQQGVKLIQRGAAEAVLVVGVDYLSAFVVAGFSALKALDPLGCRPFGSDRRGLSPGEAGAAVLLVNAASVPSPTVVIRGWGTSNDANHMTGPSRDGSGLALAIRSALRSAGLQPDEIQYVNAHGTGTSYNDSMEIQALRAVFGESCPPFNSFKGMLGHTLGAAGVIETILCTLAMKEHLLPGTPRLKLTAEDAPASLMLEPRSTPQLNHVLKLNVGFGGVNGALVLSHE